MIIKQKQKGIAFSSFAFSGSRLTPSVVSYTFRGSDGPEPIQILVGAPAKRRQLQDFVNTIYGCLSFLFDAELNALLDFKN